MSEGKRKGMPRIFLHPEWVVSYDGGRHYITAPQLAHLYGIDIHSVDVFVYDGDGGYSSIDSDIHLYPVYDGGYYNVRESM